ncbi:sugar nucleotide-binding protein [bacterium]|nr:sugar nucleotide-binding protein [bacterium]
MAKTRNKDALIGATGFVGAHLAGQHEFPALFNSRNIDSAREMAFELVVCAAAPGSMFEANRFADSDRQRVEKLISNLACIKAKRFVLISTVAVFEGFRAEAEEAANFEKVVAYGRHRRELEVFCAEHFPSCLVVRLPALFGAGLKKNFLFDILNPMPTMLPISRFEEMSAGFPLHLRRDLATIYGWNEALAMFVIDRDALEGLGRRAEHDRAVKDAGFAAELFTSPESCFQFYDMNRIWSDISLCLAAGLELAHFAPPPLQASAVYAELTGRPMPESSARVHREDMRTRHAGLWGASNPYFETTADVRYRLRRFLEAERGRV